MLGSALDFLKHSTGNLLSTKLISHGKFNFSCFLNLLNRIDYSALLIHHLRKQSQIKDQKK